MRTLGQHLATRLVEIGVTHVFGVPGAYFLLCGMLLWCAFACHGSGFPCKPVSLLAGDFNLVLLDQACYADALVTLSFLLSPATVLRMLCAQTMHAPYQALPGLLRSTERWGCEPSSDLAYENCCVGTQLLTEARLTWVGCCALCSLLPSPVHLSYPLDQLMDHACER